MAEEKQPAPAQRRGVGERWETQPPRAVSCLGFPSSTGTPGWLTGLCQAHLLQDTARRLILLRQDKGDAETPGRADGVGEMKGSEAQTHVGVGGRREADVSPRLERCEPPAEGGHRPHDTTASTHGGKERRRPGSSPPRT